MLTAMIERCPVANGTVKRLRPRRGDEGAGRGEGDQSLDPHAPRTRRRRLRLPAARRRRRPGGEHLGRLEGPPQAQADHRVGPQLAARGGERGLRLRGLPPHARGVDVQPGQAGALPQRLRRVVRRGRAPSRRITTCRTSLRPRWSRPWPPPVSTATISRSGRRRRIRTRRSRWPAWSLSAFRTTTGRPTTTKRRCGRRSPCTCRSWAEASGASRSPTTSSRRRIWRSRTPASRSACSGRARTTSSSPTTTRPATST